MVDEKPATASEVSTEAYNAFIRQLRLQAIWLSQATLTNRVGPTAPGPGDLQVGGQATWQVQPSGFRVLQEYSVLLEHDTGPSLEMNVTFGVDYASDIPLDDTLFTIFKAMNLPLNTWPYLREFLSSTMGRMNWGPFTLPAFIISPASPVLEPRNSAGRAAARRRKAQRAQDETNG